MRECVFKGQLEGREGASCHLNYSLHVGSICAVLKCVCVCLWVCVSGVEVGAAVGDTPPHTPPLPPKRLYKGGGGKGTFVTLLSNTETITLSLDTQTLWTHTNSSGTYWLSGEKRHFCVLDSPSGGPSGLKQRRKKERPEPRWASSVQLRARRTPQTFGKLSLRSWLLPSHEDLQPALPAPAARSCCSPSLLFQTR